KGQRSCRGRAARRREGGRHLAAGDGPAHGRSHRRSRRAHGGAGMRTLPAPADLTRLLRSDRPEGSSLPIWLTLAGVFVAGWIVVGVNGGSFVTVTNLQNIAQRCVALGL